MTNSVAVSSLWQERFRPQLARMVRWGRGVRDRLSHGYHQREARAMLSRLDSTERILVLCYGNICRSPYAAAALERELARNSLAAKVSQGGVFGPDRPANDRARLVSARRGIDLSSHRSRVVTAEECQSVELLVVMEPDQAQDMIERLGAPANRVLVLGDLDPEPIDSRSIPDPYSLDEAFFARVYDRIDRCTVELVGALRTKLPQVTP